MSGNNLLETRRPRPLSRRTSALLPLLLASTGWAAGAHAQATDLVTTSPSATVAAPGAQASSGSVLQASDGTSGGNGTAQPVAAENPAQAESTGLQEIIVTAQRRSENLQRAALAVSAVSGSDLIKRDISQPDNLSKLVPALVVQPSGGSASNFYVRGVGGQAGSPANENAVAFAVDGVFIGRPTGVTGNFYDLERVEVLKGPQGTLYGRNATGGAINLITRKPSLSELGADLTFQYGNYNNIRVVAAANLPVSDTLALRVAGQINRHDGYISQGYDDENSQSVRGGLLWKPSSAVSVLLAADYSNQDSRGQGSVVVPDSRVPLAPPLDARISGADPISIAAVRAAFPGPLNSGVVRPPKTDGFNRGDTYGVSATVEADLGFATLTVIPAYRKSSPNYLYYSTGFFGLTDEDNRQYSLETRLSSPDNQPLRYVVGGYFFDQQQNAQTLFSQGDTNNTANIYDTKTRSYAAFGEASYEIFSNFRIVAGGRYTKEEKDQDLQQKVFTVANPNIPYSRFIESATFDKFTWKAGFTYQATPRNLIYANVATGFKAGGLSPVAGSAGVYKPELLTAYTFGSKNRFLDNKLQLNVELFYWKYKDQQIAALTPIQTSPGVFITAQQVLNVGQARMYGFDIDAQYQLFTHGLLSLNVSYLNSKYTDFRYSAASANGLPPATGCATAVDPSVTLAAPARLYTIDCSGKPAQNAPKWSINAGYEHTFELSNGYAIIPSVNTAFQSGRYLRADYLQGQYQKAATTTDASITLRSPDRVWSLTAWVNNIEDSIIKNQAVNRPILNIVYASLRPPRTYGLRANFKF